MQKELKTKVLFIQLMFNMSEKHLLPLCDLLFAIISLTLLFCSIVFNVALTYALYLRGNRVYSLIAFCIIAFSSVVCQLISLRWYLKNVRATSIVDEKAPAMDASWKSHRFTFVCHLLGSGIFLRYSKLFVPVDLKTVKNDFRDLSIIRVVQAFSECFPMLLLQLKLYIEIQNEAIYNNLETIGGEQHQPPSSSLSTSRHQEKAFRDLNVVSGILSLCSICWALASFNKHVRLSSVRQLVLTWAGVIVQVS